MTRRAQLVKFLAAAALLGAALGIQESVFNNFLADTYDISADARGFLEFPRELPGFLVVVTAGVLSSLAVTHMGAVGAAVFGAGMLGLAFWGSYHYGLMVVLLMVASTGMHLLQPVGHSVALALSGEHNRGLRMGQMGATTTAGFVVGAGLVALLFNDIAPHYRVWFATGGCVALAVGLVYARLHIPHLHQRRARLVVKKKFRLYYLLEFLFGARKQIFLTFGFWVLVKEYEVKAGGIATLLMVASIIGIGFKPLTGMAIDRFGERAVMVADGLMLAVICLGYGYARHLTADASLARGIAYACFISDNMLFALGTGRSVYASRIADSPQELTSTLAMGISMNHVASMVLPAVGGMVWVAFGYERVFLAAAVLALLISAVASMTPPRGAQLQAGKTPEVA